MSLVEQINADIKTAMLAKDKETLEALRAIKAAFMVALTEKGAAHELNDDAALKIIQKLVKQRKDSAAIYEQNDRMELFEKEMSEAAVIEKYLPAQLSKEEIEARIKTLIAQLGASGPQDMGKVMGAASKQLAGQAEGKVISLVVKELLAAL
ncbi:MAG: GatB/YqeY domain-containing protein [Salinivirgaceae bacterium]